MSGEPKASSNLLSSEPLKITPLGAGSEVGRSCIMLYYKGKTIMVIVYIVFWL